jgi:hypothetical protein
LPAPVNLVLKTTMQQNKTAPHIGQMLRAYTRSHKISHSAWQQVSGKSYNSIINYQKQPTMRIDTLFTICQTLKHNFLREIADMLPPDMPPQAPSNQQAQVAALLQQVKDLQTQVATLKEALKLVGGR